MARDEDEQACKGRRNEEDPEHSRERTLQEQLSDKWFVDLRELICFILAVTEKSQERIEAILPGDETVGASEERDDDLQVDRLAGG